MMNLLKDTLEALTHYRKDTSEVDGVIFFNEDLNKLEQMEWSDFSRFAYDINYDINDGVAIGRRMFKPRFFIVGDDWFFARSTSRDNFEGWVYYDHKLVVGQTEIPFIKPTDDTIAFLIVDLPATSSDYTSDKYYHMMFETPVWIDSDDVQTNAVVHGTYGKVYWTGDDTSNNLPQFLTHPVIIQAVNEHMASDTDFFNNEHLSELFGIDDAGYVHDPRGMLRVAEIPVGHFTVYMDDHTKCEVVQSTVQAPYYSLRP